VNKFQQHVCQPVVKVLMYSLLHNIIKHYLLFVKLAACEDVMSCLLDGGFARDICTAWPSITWPFITCKCQGTKWDCAIL